MVPTSLSVWTQRYGRAGRAGQDADAILLVEPSVYQLKKKKTTEGKKGEENKENEAEEEQDDDDDDADDERPDQVPASHADPKFKKRVEWGMRNWVEATECRNAVSDKYFANPCHNQGAYALSIATAFFTHKVQADNPRRCCCDLCILKKVKLNQELTLRESCIHELSKRINSRHDAPAVTDPNAPQQPKTRKVTGLGRRRDERLEACKNTLSDWRAKIYSSTFKNCIFGPQTLMSDKTLTKLATSADIKTVDSIKTQIPDWIWADEYGEDVLNLLKPIDSAWKAEIDAKAKENRARAKKPKTAEAKHVEATGAPAPLHPAQVNAHVFNPHVTPYAHSAPIFYPSSSSAILLHSSPARESSFSAVFWTLSTSVHIQSNDVPSVSEQCSAVAHRKGSCVYGQVRINTRSNPPLRTTLRCDSEAISPWFSQPRPL